MDGRNAKINMRVKGNQHADEIYQDREGIVEATNCSGSEENHIILVKFFKKPEEKREFTHDALWIRPTFVDEVKK